MLDRLAAEDSFDDEVFTGVDLTAFTFDGKDFYRAVFRNCQLGESRWAGARLEDCRFEGCDLTRCKPGSVKAHGVGFVDCKLMGVEWTKASPNPQLDFEKCNLRYASFVELSLRRTRFRDCQILEANFIDSDLGECDFAGSDLTGANFQGVTLAHADFTAAHGLFLDPGKNRVKDVRVAVDTAVLLAASFGMKVAGYNDEPPRRKRR